MSKSKKKPARVVVRSYGAGVFAGELVSVKQSGAGRQRVVLNRSRRLWKWKVVSGIALSGVASSGVVLSESTIDVSVDCHAIDDVIEIIPMTEAAWRTLG